MHQAFVASSTLKPMARQLLQDRAPVAYGGVEAYARRHTKEDAGALAWLVLGYAHWLDHDPAKAIDPLNRAKSQAGDLGDYVDFYLGASYFQSGRVAEAISTVHDFDQKYPDSLLIRDARVLYANALLSEARGGEVIALLEQNRQPTRADIELALGRAYAAAGQPEKAATTLGNLYVTMPLSPEADQAAIELEKLPADVQAKAIGANGRRTRADLLMRGRRFSQAASEYHRAQIAWHHQRVQQPEPLLRGARFHADEWCIAKPTQRKSRKAMSGPSQIPWRGDAGGAHRCRSASPSFSETCQSWCTPSCSSQRTTARLARVTRRIFICRPWS